MSRRKKESNIESTTGFSNPSDLSLEELESISINSLETINDSLLSNLNWNQGAIGFVCLTLSADNQNVASSNLVLLGILWSGMLMVREVGESQIQKWLALMVLVLKSIPSSTRLLEATF